MDATGPMLFCLLPPPFLVSGVQKGRQPFTSKRLEHVGLGGQKCIGPLDAQKGFWEGKKDSAVTWGTIIKLHLLI